MKTKDIQFKKEKILTFRRYRNRIDLLSVLLEDNKEYSIKEVDSILEKFMSEVI